MDPTKSINSNTANPDINSPQRRALEIRRRAYKSIYATIEMSWTRIGEVRGRTFFMKDIMGGLLSIVPEATEEISKNFQDLNKGKLEGEPLFTKLTEIFIDIMSRYLSLEELENRLSTRVTEELGHTKLNRGLNYEIDSELQVSLHIPVTFFKDAKEARESLEEGLRVLARKLETEPELENIREIVGYSRLVRQKHLFWKDMGFTVIEEDISPVWLAKMTREKLIEKYGPQTNEKQ